MQNKEAIFSDGGLGAAKNFKRLAGTDIISNPSTILKMVEKDHGLDINKKNSLFTILNSPEAFDNIMVGLTGAALSRVVSSYSDLSKPARTLLSLAGFGVGNIIYNTLHERKHIAYDPDTGISRVKL